MKIKGKNKMLILGTSLLGLGTIIGIGCNSFINKNNNSNTISYVQIDRQADTDIPNEGVFYMYYDCIGQKCYSGSELPSDTSNMNLVEFSINFGMTIGNSNILTMTFVTNNNIDNDTYTTYFANNVTTYTNLFTDFINNALVELFNTKLTNSNQPMFNLSIINLVVPFTQNSDGTWSVGNVTYDVVNNYLNDLNNEKIKNEENQNQIKNNEDEINSLKNTLVTNNNQNQNKINAINNTLNNLEIGMIVVAIVFIIVWGVLGYFLIKKKINSNPNSKFNKEGHSVPKGFLLYSKNNNYK